MNIELKKFGTTLISRPNGKEALAAFQLISRDLSEDEDLIMDFDGIITFSPSWGDEFLTSLARTYGDRFKLKNTQNPSVKTTLEILETINSIKFNKVN